MRDHSVKTALLFLLGFVFLVSADSCEMRFDTLCIYFMKYNPEIPDHISATVIKNQDQLNDIMKKTGYNEEKKTKELNVSPDFKARTVFALYGWPCIIVKITKDNRHCSVYFQEEFRNIKRDDDAEYARPRNTVKIFSISPVSGAVTFVNCPWDSSKTPDAGR
jgi:hypothetical protein